MIDTIRRLTPMQIRVMLLVCGGHTNELIAIKLGLSYHTVKYHVHQAMLRMSAENRTAAAVRFAMEYPDELKAHMDMNRLIDIHNQATGQGSR